MEPIYDYGILKKLVGEYLKDIKNLHINFNAEVINGKIEKDGTKTLTFKKGNKVKEEKFDYVINATYAQYNKFTHWMGFPIKPVRIDFVESVIVRLPLPKISLAIMDGPFTNLVPTGNVDLYTLVHIKESIVDRYNLESGLVKKKVLKKSCVKNTLEKSMEWFPILRKAEFVETRNVYRAVNAYREHDDARPSDINYHGFGCWSILGGKIVNSVSVAKEIALIVKSSHPETEL